MLRTGLLLLAALSLPILAAGCAASDDVTEEEGETNSAMISGPALEGAQFKTTARLNLRASANGTLIRTLDAGAVVTIIDGTPQGGFYNVSVDSEEDTGWVSGKFLKDATPVEDNADDAPAAKGTGTGNIETCKASFYASGQKTANGEKFNTNDLTAAHKTLKFNTMVRVTNTATGASVDVRINDRGPFIKGRCIDLSRAAFGTIAPLGQGVASVSVETLE